MSTKENAIGRRSLLSTGAAAAGLGLLADLEAYPQNVNRNSIPSDLKVTDMRIAVLRGPGGQAGGRGGGRGPLPPATPGAGAASGGVIVVRIDSNRGISGYGQTIGDGPQPNYVLTHKARCLGENPCNVDKIFRKIKVHGAYNRRGSGVNAIENALWDLAGKAYNVPIYQMLGGKFRDKVRCYADTTESPDPKVFGERLKARHEQRFTWLKMDLGVDLVANIPGTVTHPEGVSLAQGDRTQHMFTGIEITQKGVEKMCEYVAAVREQVGMEVPLSADHFGHIGVNSCIRLGKGLEKYNLAWLEDMIPWQYTDLLKKITDAVDIPI